MSIPFHHPFQESQFDIFDWYPKFQSCQRYFLEHAQHSGPIQAVAAAVNIKLPFQSSLSPSSSISPTQSPLRPPSGQTSLGGTGAAAATHASSEQAAESLIPYIRRLIVTGFDNPAVLHGFFGDDWQDGVGPIHETERRNYLFAAKSDTWLHVKQQYDMADGQTAPFLRPLMNASLEEIQGAEASWSEWLAMQDWMLGPRAPESDGTSEAGGSAAARRRGIARR